MICECCGQEEATAFAHVADRRVGGPPVPPGRGMQAILVPTCEDCSGRFREQGFDVQPIEQEDDDEQDGRTA